MAAQAGEEVDLSEILNIIAELISEETPAIQVFDDQFESIKQNLMVLEIMLKGSWKQESFNKEEINELMTKIKIVLISVKSHIEHFIARKEKQLKQNQLKKSVSAVTNVRAQKKFTKLLKMTEEQVSELVTRGREVLSTAPHDDPSAELQQWHQEDVVGRDENLKILSYYLLSDQRWRLSTVSILGEHGVGKTTLASKIYKNPMVASHFKCRAWVTVGEEYVPQEILRNMAKQVTLEYNEADLMKDIQLVLSSRGRYLIVLDGVSTPQVWKMLREVLPITSGGCVILTTQVREVAVEAGSRGLIQELGLLTPEESWQLFCAKLGDVPEELTCIGKDIVENCRGLPLTISETVGILSREPKTVERWSWLLLELQQKGSIKHVAADALTSNLKKCLYYFLLFSEDYEIPVRRLIALWLAEGLVQPEGVDDQIPLEVTAKKYLIDLERGTVIQVLRRKPNGDIKTCQLHRVIRDTLLPKAQTAHFFSQSSRNVINIYRHSHHPETDNDGSSSSDRARGGNLPACFKNLRSFISFDPREGREPGEHIRDFLLKGIKKGWFKSLRVIDLEGVFRPIIPELVLKEMHQLRFLGLRRTYSDLVPASIHQLQKLQTLDLKYTCISNVPASIWKLKELRHLYLSQNYRTKLPSASGQESAAFPSNLQTLWGGYVDDHSPVKDGLDNLKNIRKLSLTCQMTASKQKALEEWIAKLPFLESLKLRSIDQMVQASDIFLEHLSGLTKLTGLYLFGNIANTSIISTLPQSISEVTLSLSKLNLDPMPILGLLPNLRILALLSESYTGETMMCPPASFQLLHHLKLWKLNALKEWNVGEGAMPIVGAIEIRSCHQLTVFPQSMKHLIHFQ